LQSHNTAILQRQDVLMSNCLDSTMPQRYASATLCCRGIVTLRRHTIPPSQHRNALISCHYSFARA
jgi:hypothetical protein